MIKLLGRYIYLYNTFFLQNFNWTIFFQCEGLPGLIKYIFDEMSEEKKLFFFTFFHKTKLISFVCLVFDTHVGALMLTLSLICLVLLQGTKLGHTSPRGM